MGAFDCLSCCLVDCICFTVNVSQKYKNPSIALFFIFSDESCMMNLCPCPQHQSLGFRIPHITTGFSRGSIEFGSVFVVFTIRDSAGTRAQGKHFWNTQVSWHTMILLNFQKIKALCEDDTWTVDSLAACNLSRWKSVCVVLARWSRGSST